MEGLTPLILNSRFFHLHHHSLPQEKSNFDNLIYKRSVAFKYKLFYYLVGFNIRLIHRIYPNALVGIFSTGIFHVILFSLHSATRKCLWRHVTAKFSDWVRYSMRSRLDGVLLRLSDNGDRLRNRITHPRLQPWYNAAFDFSSSASRYSKLTKCTWDWEFLDGETGLDGTPSSPSLRFDRQHEHRQIFNQVNAKLIENHQECLYPRKKVTFLIWVLLTFLRYCGRADETKWSSRSSPFRQYSYSKSRGLRFDYSILCKILS